MVDCLFLLIMFSFYLIIIAIPLWFVLLVMKIIKRKTPSPKISIAFKVVSIVILIYLPFWLFLLALGSAPMTLM